MTPIGYYYQTDPRMELAFSDVSKGYANRDTGDRKYTFCSKAMHADANRNGIVEVSDITALGQNFNAKVYGWELWFRINDSHTLLTLDNTDEVMCNSGVKSLVAPDSEHGDSGRYGFSRVVTGIASTALESNVCHFYLKGYMNDGITENDIELDSIERSVEYHNCTDAFSDVEIGLPGMIVEPGEVAILKNDSNSTYKALMISSVSSDVVLVTCDVINGVLSNNLNSYNVSAWQSVHSIDTGCFGGQTDLGRNVVLCGGDGADNEVRVCRLTSSGLYDVVSVSIDIVPREIICKDINNDGLDEVLVFPAESKTNIPAPHGYILEYDSTDDSYSKLGMYTGNGIDGVVIDDLFASTELDGVWTSHGGEIIQFSRNMNLPPSLLSLPVHGLMPGFGVALDSEVSVPYQSFMNCENVYLGIARLSQSDPFALIAAYDVLPVFAIYEQEVDESFEKHGFHLDIYRNMYDSYGNQVMKYGMDNTDYIVVDMKPAKLAGSESCSDDIVYLLHNAIGWRFGNGSIVDWDVYSSTPEIGSASFPKVRTSTYGAIYLIDGGNGTAIEPKHMDVGSIESGESDYDDILVSVLIGSETHLMLLKY